MLPLNALGYKLGDGHGLDIVANSFNYLRNSLPECFKELGERAFVLTFTLFSQTDCILTLSKDYELLLLRDDSDCLFYLSLDAILLE